MCKSDRLPDSLTVLELKQPWQHLYDDHLYDDFRCSRNTRLNCNSHILKKLLQMRLFWSQSRALCNFYRTSD